MHEIDTNWYDHGGRIIDPNTAVDLLMDPNYCTIARTQVVDQQDPMRSFLVSTVWLGRNYGEPEGPLRIFETIVRDFGGNQVGGGRYGHTAAAWEGHERLVGDQKAKCVAPSVLNVHRSTHVPA